MIRLIIVPLLITSLLLVAATAGCSPKFTRERYETLRAGEESGEVQRTLGEPTQKSDGTWTYIGARPYRKAVIRFDADGRLISMDWSDTREIDDAPVSP